jgi:hypothetical protein
LAKERPRVGAVGGSGHTGGSPRSEIGWRRCCGTAFGAGAHRGVDREVARCLEELVYELVVGAPNFAAMYATRGQKVKAGRA